MSIKQRNPVHRNMQRCGAGAHDSKKGEQYGRESMDDILDMYYEEYFDGPDGDDIFYGSMNQ